MRDPGQQKERLQIPLMFAFRDAYAKKDASRTEDVRVDGERVISDRNMLRRRGADERMLKRDLSLDLASLAETIDLGSTEDLSDLPYVRQSVVNFGLPDLASISVGSEAAELIGDNLKQALLAHEPRLNPKTLHVNRGERSKDELEQKLRFKVVAEMVCNPLDVPIEFVAELDDVIGKVALPRLPGSA